MHFFPFVYKEKTEENPSGFKYIIRFKNKGFRDIIDLELFAKLRIQGLYPIKPWAWKAIYIPIDDERIPKIASQRKNKKRTAIQLCISKISEEAKASLPEKLQIKCNNKTICLEDLLKLDNKPYLQIFAFGYDSFSGTRRIFESINYSIEHIKDEY